MQKKNWLLYSRMIVYILVVLFFLVNSVGHFEGLNFIISVLSILAIGLSLFQGTSVTKFFSFSFLSLGTLFLINFGVTINEYIGMFGEMLSLLSLFAIIPILAIPIKIGGYEEAASSLLNKNVKTPFQFYRNISLLSYFFAIFLNLATLPVMYHSFKSAVGQIVKTGQNRLISSSILQGYSLSLTWSPFSAMVGVILTFTGVNWLSVFPKLLLISLLPLFVKWLYFYVIQIATKNKFKDYNHDAADLEINTMETLALRKLAEVSVSIFILILIIVLIDTNSSISLLIISTISSIPFAWLWSNLIKKGKEFNQACLLHFKQYVPSMYNLFAVFLSAGFFANVLSFTGYNQVINNVVISFSNMVPISVFLISLPLITLSIACFGLHPIVTVALLAQSLNPELIGIQAESITIALLGGSVLTYFLSPFSGTMGLMSVLTKCSSSQISKWNMSAAFVFYFILSISLLIF